MMMGMVGFSGGSHTQGASAAYTNFAARCTTAGHTLVGAEITNYQTLLDGLTNDGFFDGSGNSSLLDALYITAAPAAVIAVLNLVKNANNLTAQGSPAFATNAGYTGVDGSSTVYLDTNYNTSTGGGLLTQNSAHIAIWSNNTTSSAQIACGNFNATAAGSAIQIFPKFNGDGNFYGRLNLVTSGTDAKSASSGQGHYLVNRTAASGTGAQVIYINGADPGDETTTGASAVLTNCNLIYLNAKNFNGGAPNQANGWAGQMSAGHFGAQLTSGQISNIYSRIGTYRTAVGL